MSSPNQDCESKSESGPDNGNRFIPISFDFTIEDMREIYSSKPKPKIPVKSLDLPISSCPVVGKSNEDEIGVITDLTESSEPLFSILKLDDFSDEDKEKISKTTELLKNAFSSKPNPFEE